ncbi:citrate carrier protein, CCS family [Dethiosulfatibacter aminovorans DSM 17477]|uniref:Citrate carrier protein, CCS family n=1 Tax=Dethiosulfatibacter aminovorans DSM 17477 TaxID=1121476 RepID=A0A1M6J817_9FIRM|nr:2-hydroxycarboxylate transporter family protein [Dethiosulfatibacter aminovorans]SHJ42814.1 citrate carrier protein, CCS family [Dethiosulfatibacter aminovorans DSM 17477]
MSNLEKKTSNESGQTFSIMGIELPYFIIIAIIYIIAVYSGNLPSGLIVLGFMMVLGAILDLVGNYTPIIKSYLGGGAIVAIFGSALLSYFGLIPEATVASITEFMKGGEFLNFYIAALICGSILGMSRDLLIKAFAKYLPIILGGVAAALVLVGIAGMIIGYGFKEAVLYIGIPIMGGGMGAGAIPLSEIYGQIMEEDPGNILTIVVPALALGNAVAIVAGGLLSKLGSKYPKLTGYGKLLISQENVDDFEVEEKRAAIDIKLMGIGIAIACMFYVLGNILSKFIPIHRYALMIISVALVKGFNLLPEKYGEGCHQWYAFVSKNFTAALLVGIGFVYINIQQLADAFTIQYILLVIVTVIGSIIGSGFVGRLLGFYPIEAAITGGLCMANMGGTGDVAVLSASKRMELMPFAQISSRLGGAFMILLATALLNLFI